MSDILSTGTRVEILGSEYGLRGKVVGYSIVERPKGPKVLMIIELEKGFWSEKQEGSDRYQCFVSMIVAHRNALNVLHSEEE